MYEGVAFLIGVLIFGTITGAFTAWVASEKGRSEGTWFVLGFFFSVLALLAVGLAPAQVAGAQPDDEGELEAVGIGEAGEDDWLIRSAVLQQLSQREYVLLDEGDEADLRTPNVPPGFERVPGDGIVWVTDDDGSEPIAVIRRGITNRYDVLSRIVREYAGDVAHRIRIET